MGRLTVFGRFSQSTVPSQSIIKRSQRTGFSMTTRSDASRAPTAVHPNLHAGVLLHRSAPSRIHDVKASYVAFDVHIARGRVPYLCTAERAHASRLLRE